MEQLIDWGISGNEERIFISVAYGCNYNCKYCYLNEMDATRVVESFSKQQILEELEKKQIFISGEQGSIISLGCFTECWDDAFKETTIELIKYFLKQRNYVQVSTKKAISTYDLAELEKEILFDKQLNIFVSIPTISHQKEYEPIADEISERVKVLGCNKSGKINTCIYIKPLLPGVTLQDRELYKDLAKRYRCPVVVGDMLQVKYQEKSFLVQIGNQKMKEISNEEAEELRHYLHEHTVVYPHSTDIIKKERKKRSLKALKIAVQTMGAEVDIYIPQEMQSCDMGDNLVPIQNIISQDFEKITVHFHETLWIDNLVMIEFFLILYEIKKSGKRIFFDFLVDSSEIEQIRFKQYFKEYGFLDAAKLLSEEALDTFFMPTSDDTVNRFEMEQGNFHSSECFQPFIFLDSQESIPDFVNEIAGNLTKLLSAEMSEYEIENIRFGTVALLQETLGNVYEHAYDKGENGVCGVMIRFIHNPKDETKNGNCRRYLSLKESETKPFRKAKFDKNAHRNVAAAVYNPYRNEGGMNVLEKYMQIFVVDLGKGLLKSMDITDASMERNIINEIFEKGRRSNKMPRNTYLGGLGMIYRLLGEKENYISVKGNYNWASIFCGKRNDTSSTLQYVHRDGYHADQTLKGLAVIGYIDSQSENETTSFLCADEKIAAVYNKQYSTAGELKTDDVNFLDLRFSIPNLKNVEWKMINICFAGKNIEKGLIANSIAAAISASVSGKTLIIVDIPEREMRKYELAFYGMSEKIHRVILITMNLFVAVFEPAGTGLLEFQAVKTQRYINNMNLNNPAESLAALLHLVRFHDSRKFWSLVSDLQRNSQVNAFINGKVGWPEKEHNELEGYLDFSQTCFDDSVKHLLAYQLLRIPAGNRHRFFRSMDRFADDICDNVNGKLAAMQSTDGNDRITINIGSVFVTGISSKKSKLDFSHVDKEYYFFVRESKLVSKQLPTAKALLMWPEKKLTDKLFSKNDDLKFERLSKTPFIAKGGTTYFAEKHYDNIAVSNCNSIYVHPIALYGLLEQERYWTNKLIKTAHFTMGGHHDIIYLNPVALFHRNIMEGGKNDTFIEQNSYDFLLWQMYSALGKSSTKDFLEAVKSDIKKEYQAVTFGKLKERACEITTAPGVFVYFTDYETLEIMESMRKIFSGEVQKRIIPIAPISSNREATAFLLSPILLDNIQEKIEEIKKRYNNEAAVTIFCATVASPRLQRELKHILYRLGATSVKCICLVDRQRFPLGPKAKDSYVSFCKLDLPQLGMEGNCGLCTGLERLQQTKDKLIDGPLASRCHEIRKIWGELKSFDNYCEKGISARTVNWPQPICNLIEHTSSQYGWDRTIQIRTDVGLALFAIENTAITMSIDFLKTCLDEAKLQKEVKVLLICLHLLLFENEIAESDRYEMIRDLYDYLKEETNYNEYTALTCLLIMAQESKIKKKLYKEVFRKAEHILFSNSDYMITVIELSLQNGDKNDFIPFCGYLKNQLNIYSSLYGIMLYTYNNLETKHGTILMKMKSAMDSTPQEDYISAQADVDFLSSAYQMIPASCFPNPADIDTDKENIIGILAEIRSLLQKGMNGRLKDSADRDLLTQNINSFFQQAKKMNDALYMDTSSPNILQLEKKLKELTNSVNSRNIQCHVNHIIYTGPDKYYFCFTEDLRRELVYLMEDLRYADSESPMKGDDGESYTGIVEVSFEEEHMIYRFKNHVKTGFSIHNVQLQKKLKRFRPTIVSLCHVLNKEKPEDVFAYHYCAETNLYTAEIKIEYLNVKKGQSNV